MGKAVVMNCCPWCSTVFSSKQVARYHVRTRQEQQHCPSTATWHPHELHVPRKLQCNICSQPFSGVVELHLHITTHYDALGSNSETEDSTSSCATSSDSSETDGAVANTMQRQEAEQGDSF
ncbi:unnamed protein product [Polarella glacialis]|uniref:C2H2-type domain-containing protein n=1 Tax=Polarella glacialis TaxID=89957 RepID=A0A813K7J6_POLGL|nr:unnamed protein product [Polarella glacialis]